MDVANMALQRAQHGNSGLNRAYDTSGRPTGQFNGLVERLIVTLIDEAFGCNAPDVRSALLAICKDLRDMAREIGVVADALEDQTPPDEDGGSPQPFQPMPQAP